MKGFKVFNPDFTCRGLQFEVGKEYKEEKKIKICHSGFHFCLKAVDCFNYYSFNPENIVCEVEALGQVQTHEEDSKACTNHIKIVRRLSWEEVLTLVNTGKYNTGIHNSGDRNSGYRNSGDWNSGYRNSGYRNSGDRNSGDWNSGDRNSGDWNSGDRNSGDWNSGDRNSGDSNSGYRNSGAFCADNNPKMYLFDKPSSLTVREWESSRAVQIMWEYLKLNIWVEASLMTEEEKKQFPKYQTTGGYLKRTPYKEAWSNMWGNLSDEYKAVFTSLENFDPEIFESITGIKVEVKK